MHLIVTTALQRSGPVWREGELAAALMGIGTGLAVAFVVYRVARLVPWPVFDGYSTVVPFAFLESYVGASPLKVRVLKAGVRVSVTVKARAALSRRGREYSRWAESFLDKLSLGISKDEFFSRIQWETVETVLICLRTKASKESKRRPSDAAQ